MSLAATLSLTATLGTTQIAPPVSYGRFAIGKATYHQVTADLSSGTISLETVHSPKLTSVWNLLSRGKPYAAITGTFFSPSSQKPVADLLIDGNLVSHGSIGSAIGVTWYGNVNIFDRPFHSPVDWGEYRFGLRGTVRIVANGKVQPNPRAQRFRDRRIWGRAARTGLGLTESGKLVLVATKGLVSLTELGKAMKSRGVTDAVSLDGGGSTCLYYKGSLVVPPSRKLSNLFVLRPAEMATSMGLPISGSLVTATVR